MLSMSVSANFYADENQQSWILIVPNLLPCFLRAMNIANPKFHIQLFREVIRWFSDVLYKTKWWRGYSLEVCISVKRKSTNFSFLHSKCKKVQNIETHRTLSFTVTWLLVSFKIQCGGKTLVPRVRRKRKRTEWSLTRCYIWLPIPRSIYVLFCIWSVILHVLLLSALTVAFSRMPSTVLETAKPSLRFHILHSTFMASALMCSLFELQVKRLISTNQGSINSREILKVTSLKPSAARY